MQKKLIAYIEAIFHNDIKSVIENIVLFVKIKKRIKLILLQIMLLYPVSVICQSNLFGFYEFSNRITYRNIDLKIDSTFKYKYATDIYRKTRTGSWKTKNDTLLILSFSPDTSIEKRYKVSGEEFIDTSIYEKSVEIWFIIDNETLHTRYDTLTGISKKSNKKTISVYPASFYYKTKQNSIMLKV